MIELAHIAGGAILAIAGWLVPRHIAGARARLALPLPFDAAPLALAAALLAVATGRPIFAGLIVFSLGAGFAFADWTMRQILREPAVFSESCEIPLIFTHPHLYLPFAGPGLVIGGALAAVLGAAALFIVEPAAWLPHPILALLGAAFVLAAGRIFAREPGLGALASTLRRLDPTGEPAADAAALGPFATVLTHCILARAERAARRAALAAPAIPRNPAVKGPPRPTRPLILVQCESFFDARRLSPLVPRELLAGFGACSESGTISGRLEVPGWGANTMRAEFAVLTGIREAELGYDRFNPYYAFARVPIASQVWRLRQAGYRTICLHPFDRWFYRRDLSMPAVGFERFLGRETLGGSKAPPYYPDPALAHDILRVLDAEGPGTFIFAITMGNHGPWLNTGWPVDRGLCRLLDAANLPQGDELVRYLDGLRRSDEMLRVLMDGLAQRQSDAVLALYGDHLPSLPRAFDHFGFTEPHSDYVVWSAAGGVPCRADLAAHRLGHMLVDSLLADGHIGAHPGDPLAAATPG